MREESGTEASERLKEASSVEYFCREDAETAAEKLCTKPSMYHAFELQVGERATYARGRPPKNGPRKVSSIRYVIEGGIVERSEEIERARREAGCFAPGVWYL